VDDLISAYRKHLQIKIAENSPYRKQKFKIKAKKK